MATNKYLLTQDPVHVITVSTADGSPREAGRVLAMDGSYAAGPTAAWVGVTMHNAYGPGVLQTAPTVAAIAVQAYAVGSRFTLTAPQAVNAGGQAGIYQVIAAFTPAATTLTAGEALNVFYVGPALQVNAVYANQNPSLTPLYGTRLKTYQMDHAVLCQGTAIVEVAAAVTVGQLVSVVAASDGRVGPAAATDRIIGVAKDAATGVNGDVFIRVLVKGN